MDMRSRFLDLSNRVSGSVRKLANRITVFFDPKSKVFIDKGLYVVDEISESNNAVLDPKIDYIQTGVNSSE